MMMMIRSLHLFFSGNSMNEQLIKVFFTLIIINSNYYFNFLMYHGEVLGLL